MKKFIEVYDDFIPKFLADEVENFCINSGEIGFQFIPNVTGLDQSKHLPGMSRLFYTDNGKVSEYSKSQSLSYKVDENSFASIGKKIREKSSIRKIFCIV